jgi:hypothetical protein
MAARKKPPVADDRTGRLIAARDKLATLIAECESGREAPGLIREYRLILAEIAGLGAGEEIADVVDQLAKRRTAQAKAAEGA